MNEKQEREKLWEETEKLILYYIFFGILKINKDCFNLTGNVINVLVLLHFL